MSNGSNKNQAIIDSAIKKLFVQFRFNFEFLGYIKSDPFCAYKYLLESKKTGKKNLDGSEIIVLEDASDPFGLDRVCHLNSLFAFGHPVKPYIFKDDGYKAQNHITFEAFPFMYGITFFDLLDGKEAAPLIFPTDYNFYEEGLTKGFLENHKYDHGFILPIYHQLHNEVFDPKYFKSMHYNPVALDLKYTVVDYPAELKNSIIIINFALTMLFNIILIESVFVDLFGYNRIKMKFDFKKAIDRNNSNLEKLMLLAFLLFCLHPFAYAVTYGIFRDRYAMRNDLPLKTPHGSFYFGTDAERNPFKKALQEAIKSVITYKHKNNSLTKEEKNALLWLSDAFGIGYSSNLEMHDANKHFWEKVDYSPQGVKDKTFITGATEDSPLWRMWYCWWGAYWSYNNLIEICKNNRKVLDKQLDDKISKEVSIFKFDFIYETSKLAQKYLIQKIKDPNLSEKTKAIFRKQLKKIWDISTLKD